MRLPPPPHRAFFFKRFDNYTHLYRLYEILCKLFTIYEPFFCKISYEIPDGMPGFPVLSLHGYILSRIRNGEQHALSAVSAFDVEAGGVFGCVDRPVEIGETGTPLAAACPCEREQQQQD